MSTYIQCDAQGCLEGNVENSPRGEIGLEDKSVYIVWISAFCGIREKSRAGSLSLRESVSLELHCSLNPCLPLVLNKPQRKPESLCLGLGVLVADHS